MAAEDEEEGLSQDQRLRRQRNEQPKGVRVSSLVGAVLLLVGMLAASQLRDWRYYKEDVADEKGHVGEFAIREIVHVEKIKHQAEMAQGKLELKRLQSELDRLREEHKAAGGHVVTKKQKPPKAAKGKEGKQGKGSKPKKKKVKIQVSKQEAADLAAKKAKPNTVKALGKEGYRAYLQADYEKKMANHEKKMVPRKFQLSADLQEIVDSYDGSLSPPKYCYESPTGKSVHPREPDEEDSLYADLDLEVAKKILRLASAEYPCLVLSRECADDKEKHQYADRYYNHLHKMYFVNKEGENSTLTREEILRRLPDFPAQKLGTCAIVGNADNVLEGKYGEEIDEHDFVVRFNVVTKPFSEFVGTKAGGMLVKTNYKDTEYKRDVVPTMYNLFPKVSVRISSRPSKRDLLLTSEFNPQYVPFELDPSTLPGERPPLVYNSADYSDWRRDEEQMFWAYLEEKNLTHFAGEHVGFGIPKIPHPTGGISRVRSLIQLLRSGVCDRLDMYGFSVGGGKYFQPEKVVSHAHPIQSENYFYRLWMATGVQGKFCVYGK